MQSKKIKAIRHLSERHRQVTVEYLEDMLENFCNAELKKTQMVFRENITYMSNTLYYIKIKLYRGLLSGPVLRIYLIMQGTRFNPWSGN